MSIPIGLAARKLQSVVDALSQALEAAKVQRLRPHLVAQLNLALQRSADVPGTASFQEAARVLVGLAEASHLTPKTTDDAHTRIAAILKAPVKSRLGPANPGTATDWYCAALGTIAQSFEKLASIEYVRTKAGNFGARQTAEQAGVALQGASNLLGWILQSEDENHLSASDALPSANDDEIIGRFSRKSRAASAALDQRAEKAKALFDFLAHWNAPALPEMSAAAVKACIISGHEPFVMERVFGIASLEERRALSELATYRRALYDSAQMGDSGHGTQERVFANVYDAIFAHLALHGEYGAKDYDLYRGHHDSRWKLEASYYRGSTQSRAHRENPADVISGFFGVHTGALDDMSIEERSERMTRLQRNYPGVHLEGLTALQQEAVIQHYLSGTKLLDFTTSIYVAAFFATAPCERRSDIPRPDMGAIYRIGVRDITELALAQVESPELPERFARIHRQNGVFLKIRFREAINEPGLWDRWVFRHSKVADPFQCPEHGITQENLLAEDISNK